MFSKKNITTDEFGTRYHNIYEQEEIRNGLAKRQKLADLFCEYYKAITGKEAHIIVELNPTYKYTNSLEDKNND